MATLSRFALTEKGAAALESYTHPPRSRWTLTLDGWAALAKAEGKALLWQPSGFFDLVTLC